MNLQNLFQTYGLPTVIISAVISLATFIIGKVLKDKAPLAINSYIPFVLGIVISLIYDMCLAKAFVFREEAICSGMLCGSLSGVICSFFATKGNQQSLSEKALAIYSVLQPIVQETSLISLSAKVEKICLSQATEDEKIAEITTNVMLEAKQECLDTDFQQIAKLCIQTVNSIK